MSAHPEIRSAEACYKSSSLAVELAKRHDTKLHVLHVSTAREVALFAPGPLAEKRITAEACVHHLWFDQSRYGDLGARIKCNPAIKTAEDRDGLLEGVRNGCIDVIATDHAPHTLAEKAQTYFKAPAGLPLVQHALPVLLELCKQGVLSLERVAERTAHNPATLFGVVDRGFIREGCFADLVAVDLEGQAVVTRDRLRYKCGWSPFEGDTFNSKIALTMVNGEVVYQHDRVVGPPRGTRLEFAPR
jgi:dihydroorotase